MSPLEQNGFSRLYYISFSELLFSKYSHAGHFHLSEGYVRLGAGANKVKWNELTIDGLTSEAEALCNVGVDPERDLNQVNILRKVSDLSVVYMPSSHNMLEFIARYSKGIMRDRDVLRVFVDHFRKLKRR